MSDRRWWAWVGSGLELKFAGLILFAALPGLGALLWFGEADPLWMLLGVGLVVAPDFLGRCLCLVAPRPARWWVALSTVFQIAAFGSLAACAWFAVTDSADDSVGLISLGVGLAVVLQLVAAFLFTRFLRNAGEQLGHPEVSSSADQLNWRLVSSLIASWSLGSATFIAAAVVLVVGIATCGFGFYVATPIAALLLLPLVLLTLGLTVAMYWTYGATMIRLRVAIRDLRSWDDGVKKAE